MHHLLTGEGSPPRNDRCRVHGRTHVRNPTPRLTSRTPASPERRNHDLRLTYEVSVTPDVYRRIREGIGSDRPKGLIVHLAYQADSDLRYLDVRHSKEEFDSFTTDRLHPVVTSVLQEALGFVPPEPEHAIIDVIDVWSADHSGM